MPKFRCEVCGLTTRRKKAPLHCGQKMVEVKRKRPSTDSG